jgi:prepilin-type N-terminal cleavage/methylation domain-containing protein
MRERAVGCRNATPSQYKTVGTYTGIPVLVSSTKGNWALSCDPGLGSANYDAPMKSKSSQRRQGFTLVEIMIVVAIIALLASIAVPGFLRARKRSQASRILNDLRLIDNACDMYAIETNRKTNDPIRIADWTNYLKKGSNLYLTGNDILGHAYGAQKVDSIPSVPSATKTALSDVVDATFWSPYN